MAVDPAAARRRQNARARRGGLRTGRVCTYCGSLQLSHFVPEGIDPDAATDACPLCHLLLDAAQRDAGVEFRPVPETIPERIISADRALAVAFRGLADGVEDRANALQRFLTALDAEGIDWRNLPGARP